MGNKSQRNQSETARRRKRTVITKVHEYGKLPGVQVALFVYYKGQYTTYRSNNRRNWPPSMEEIVSSTLNKRKGSS
jgi:Uma2 family endonuclease